MPDTTHFSKVYRQQGGDRMVVKSGGSFDVESGGEIDIESGGSLKLAGTALTATAAELNALAATGLDATELGYLNAVVAGTASASKAAVLGTNKNLDVLAIADGGLSLGAGAGTAVTSTAAELNLLDGSIAGTAVASKALVLGATKNVDTIVVTNIDAGASGTAGTVDVFPATAAKGKLAISVTDQTGDTTVGLVVGAMAAARTITLPDPGAAASIVHTGSNAQTIAGDLTVSGTLTNAAYTQTATNIDAGASGTAGTIDIFPATAAKGKLAMSVTDQTGNTIVSLVTGAMAAARTITLADPLADADILTGKMAAVARTATVDGLTTGTIADAGMIQFVAVTAGGDANSIIVLPTPTPGRIVILYVGATGYELRSSAPASVAINGGTGATAESAIGANTMAVLICTSATTWHGFQIAAAVLSAVEAAA